MPLLYERLGWGLFVLAASCGVHVWYLSMDTNDVREAWVGARVVIVFVALGLWRVQGLVSGTQADWLLPARALIALASAVTGLGVLVPHAPIAIGGSPGFCDRLGFSGVVWLSSPDDANRQSGHGGNRCACIRCLH